MKEPLHPFDFDRRPRSLNLFYATSLENVGTGKKLGQIFLVLMICAFAPGNFQFDVTGGYVSSLPNPQLTSYVTDDVRIAWEYTKRLELSFVAPNLVGPHAEFGAVEIPRSFYGKVAVRF
jgi:hypothetical protein